MQSLVVLLKNYLNCWEIQLVAHCKVDPKELGGNYRLAENCVRAAHAFLQ